MVLALYLGMGLAAVGSSIRNIRRAGTLSRPPLAGLQCAVWLAFLAGGIVLLLATQHAGMGVMMILGSQFLPRGKP